MSTLGEDLAKVAQERGLGFTGLTQDGKIDPLDRGTLNLSIGMARGQVLVNFGAEISALALSAKQARDIANLLIHHAALLDRANGVTRGDRARKRHKSKG